MLLSLISAVVYSRISSPSFTDSGNYLSTHSPFAVIFEFLVGMFLFYERDKRETLIPIVLIGLIGSIYGIDRFVSTSLFGVLVYCLAGKNVNCGDVVGKILKILDEYSFSIYLGHTTVMFIMSRIQEQVGFGNMKLAVFDLIGCFLFIPILHELIEKTGAKMGKKILNVPAREK